MAGVNLCTSGRLVACSGGARADGEDLLGCDGGADRALESARLEGHRASRIANTPEQLEALKVVARQRIEAGQIRLDLGLEVAAAAAVGGPLEIVGSRKIHLWDALSHCHDTLGFEAAAGGDEVFRQLTLARIIEPTRAKRTLTNRFRWAGY